MSPNQISRLTRAASLLVVLAGAMLANQEVEALPTLACIRDNILNKITSNLIANSAVIEQYKAAVETASKRFQRELETSETLKVMDDKEKENHFLKLVAEEVNKLKEEVTGENVVEKQDAKELLDEKTQACLDDESYNTDMWYHWDPEAELRDDDLEQNDDELFAKLEGIEQEMGFALDESTKEALKLRTKSVLTDILNNEARQIAMSVLTAYLTGGSSGMGFMLAPLVSGLKVKVVEFLLNSVIDVVSSVMKYKIEIKPADQLANGAPAQPQPISAAA